VCATVVKFRVVRLYFDRPAEIVDRPVVVAFCREGVAVFLVLLSVRDIISIALVKSVTARSLSPLTR
jgi:hypothetical protein